VAARAICRQFRAHSWHNRNQATLPAFPPIVGDWVGLKFEIQGRDTIKSAAFAMASFSGIM
jgi:hypothetical protein